MSTPRVQPRALRYSFIVFTVALAATIPLATTGIVSVIDGSRPAGMHLAKSAAYTLLSPLCELLDGLVSLSPSQHGWLLAALIGLAVAAGLAHPRRRSLRRAAALILLVPILYAALILASVFLPRPQASLAVDDPELLVLDLHSHTRYSHDGWKRFSVERSRAWHARAGFHAAYLTDHNVTRAWPEAQAGNPVTAGAGMTFLPGEELSLSSLHLLALGPGSENLSGAAARQLHHRTMAFIAELHRREDLATILSVPEYLGRAWPYFSELSGLVDGLEVVNGAPPVIGIPRLRLAPVIEAARRIGRPLTAGTDLHGWGYTCYAWSVMRLPGWRTLSPPALDEAIRRELKQGGFGGVLPVARDTVRPADSWRGPLAVAALPWGILRSLTLGERLAWLAWWMFVVFPAGRLLPRRRGARG